MDVSEPTTQAPRPAPVVIDIPSGAGVTGYRQLWSDSDSLYLARLRDQLLGHGFVFVSIDYRLGPFYQAAAQIEDAKCAVRFLRAHASELWIDPQRIGLYGNSFGAYLASMVGTAGPGAGFDVGQYPNNSSRVQAVVSIGGLSDLTNERATPSGTRVFMQIMHGNAISTPAYSPLTYAAPDDPPFLLLYGMDHPFARPLNAQELAKRLHAVGVPATVVLVQHGGDGLNAAPPGEIQQPGPDALVQMINRFFVKTLAL
jgi:acetyl esterase/lipase